MESNSDSVKIKWGKIINKCEFSGFCSSGKAINHLCHQLSTAMKPIIFM